ncbi:retinol dehydrogenase 14-like [Ambystoma mexicanum]|uniref:retinol dehydrogenase 14-like n=1 Tax=Ambystoma mexicanum TaxID=8296 RepID=UPI0037E7F0F4
MDLLALLAHPAWFLCSLVLALVLRAKRKARWHPRACSVDLSGKTALVTGANTGIGKCVALDLARRNARVVLACRSRERGQEALVDIQKKTGSRNVVLRIIDTSSLASVRAFADQVLQEEKRLDILINNAGASGLPVSVTSEGLELTHATNFLGPFLLTNLLLGLMTQSTHGRIVNLSSFMHRRGRVNLKNMKGEELERVAKDQTYNNTKLMNILFSNELARRLQGTGVTANSVNPGVVRTEVMRHYPWILRVLFHALGFLLFKSPEEGAASTIYCAVSEDVSGISGKYFESDCSLVLPSKDTQDRALAAKLWEACELATGLSDAKRAT